MVTMQNLLYDVSDDDPVDETNIGPLNLSSSDELENLKNLIDELEERFDLLMDTIIELCDCLRKIAYKI